MPRLLHEDHSRHVLIIEDLGDDLILVDEWLVPSKANRHCPSPDLCQSVGERLGSFLACIHRLDVSKSVLRSFDNPDVLEFVGREVVGKAGEHLKQYLSLQKDEADAMIATIKDDYEFINQQSRGMFSIGDLWTGSILVSQDGKRIALIDFEFAGEGKALHDMAQLGMIAIPSAYTLLQKVDENLQCRCASTFTGNGKRRGVEFEILYVDLRDSSAYRILFTIVGRRVASELRHAGSSD